jgi:hypothetical protein
MDNTFVDVKGVCVLKVNIPNNSSNIVSKDLIPAAVH